MESNATVTQPWLEPSQPLDKRAMALLSEMTVAEKLSQLNYRNAGISRLGMDPYVWWNEALHGLARSGAATVFPQAIGMAATFNPDRVREMAGIIAREGRARHHESVRRGDYGTYKGLTFWSPNINIFRDPRWGRGHETYGEDPVLTATMGTAYVEGLQGRHPRFLQAVATPKHYAVHSGPELTRLSFDSVADERDLRETYLPAFEACIKAGAQSIMTAYNAYNGEPCSTNTYLISEILRKEWGFEGVVVTDAGAGEALYKEHKRVGDYPEALARELARGVDVIVDWEEGAQEAWDRGLIEPADLDRAVLNQLRVKFKLGFFDQAEEVPLADAPLQIIECEDHRRAAREATRESLVLLKNDSDLLPLDRTKVGTIAVIGPNADVRDVLLGNYHGTPTRQVTALEGVLAEVENSTRVIHARGCELLSDQTEACAESCDRYAEAVSAAAQADVAILCLGLNPTIEGESGDAFNAQAGGDKLGLELAAAQEDLVERVAATGTPMIVLMFAGSAVISPAVERHARALLHCWYPGAEGGALIAQTLFGDHNPAGRLPVTFYRITDDLPPFEDYAMTERTYRFFTGEPAYPFGFGLSYTKFEYDDLMVQASDGTIDVAVTVKNVGVVAGEEVVQVYVVQEAEFRTPNRRLVAFQRVSMGAAETKRIEFIIPSRRLELIDPYGERLAPGGRVSIAVGGSQGDWRSMERGAAESAVTEIML